MFPVAILAVSTTGVVVHEVESDHELVSADPLVDRYITEVKADASKNTARITIINHFKIFLCVVIHVIQKIKQVHSTQIRTLFN